HLSSAVAEVQARQHGRAAALHRAAAVVSADAVCTVAAPQRGAGRVGRGLRADLEAGLEPAGLSERRLVLQSVRLAIAVRVRRLVRARRHAAARRFLALAHRAGGRHRLPGLRLRHHLDLALRVAGPFRADLAGGVDVSDRQDQSRRAALCAFPGAGGGDDPLHPAQLVRPEMGDPATRHPLRSALARDFLSRRVSGLCRTIHCRGILRRPTAADGRQCVRHYHYDRYRQPYIVVQGHRRAQPPIARQITRRRPRGRRGMTFVIAVLTTIALLNGAAMAEPDVAAAPAPAAPCDVPEWLLPADADLTHIGNEIKDRHRLDISVVGSGSSALSGPDGARFAYPAQLEQSLRERLPGLEIKVTAHVQSRQTTADMASQLQKILTGDQPALVIWQAGTV